MHACLPKETENRGLQNWAPVNAALKYVSRIRYSSSSLRTLWSFVSASAHLDWVRAVAARALMCGPLQMFSSSAHALTAGEGDFLFPGAPFVCEYILTPGWR